MWVLVNGRWHSVAWTDPKYISFHGEMLHKTRCGLTKILLSYRTISPADPVCGRCKNLMTKDSLS